MLEIFGKCMVMDIFAENDDKYFLSDELDPNGWLILMMNPFQMNGKNLFYFPIYLDIFYQLY